MGSVSSTAGHTMEEMSVNVLQESRIGQERALTFLKARSVAFLHEHNLNC